GQPWCRAGSSGAVLAKRLSADPPNSKVVLEVGPEDKDTFAHIPATFFTLFRSDVDWIPHRDTAAVTPKVFTEGSTRR
ncbi:GMC family oxidoreductase N-terminal domain-containing protein, partial [Rhodococcus fascians]|uniref:GMC family oxidoreductase N-terminal domain-containing protein n=1 Tax=Rhodococcoides fascians TaxID=1828 RepID=UPI0024B90C54